MGDFILPIILAVFTLVGTVVTVVASRKTSDRASAVQIMELGMTKFVENLEGSLAKCEGRCDDLESKLDEVEKRLDVVVRERDHWEAEAIKLQVKLLKYEDKEGNPK